MIESGAAADGPAATIKLHHNVGGLPEDLSFELIEPLRDLFKDEVRRLGLQLGLPEEIVWRHPFPGPGLAVRCLGEVTRPRLDKLREADAIVVDEIKAAGLYRQTAQVFAVLLPVQSVGVMGDARTYEDVIAVRAVNTEDFMTADWCHLPYDLLARDFHADHQRSEGRQPRGLRHQLEAAGDDRMGMNRRPTWKNHPSLGWAPPTETRMFARIGDERGGPSPPYRSRVVRTTISTPPAASGAIGGVAARRGPNFRRDKSSGLASLRDLLMDLPALVTSVTAKDLWRCHARRGLSLVELLASLVITLIVMAATVQLFGTVSNAINFGRAGLETNDRVRSVVKRLRTDFAGLTCDTIPWQRPETASGYLEILKGPGRDSVPPARM